MAMALALVMTWGRGTFIPCWWESILIQPLQVLAWRVLRHIKTILQYDQAVRVLGMCPEGCLPIIEMPAHPLLLFCPQQQMRGARLDGHRHLTGCESAALSRTELYSAVKENEVLKVGREVPLLWILWKLVICKEVLLFLPITAKSKVWK